MADQEGRRKVACGLAIAQHRTQVRRIFDSIAWMYDGANHLLSAGLDHRWRARAASACGLGPGATALDLCAGTGDLAIALVRRMGPRGRVVALDFSRPMLEIARAKLARAGLACRVMLLEGAAEAVPLADASVDAAASAFGLRNLEDPDRGLAEMVRVVRPGGRVVVLEFHQPSRRGMAAAALGLYFRRILPTLGRWASSGEAYAYLVRSVEAFGPVEAMADRMRRAGLCGPHVEPLPGGIAAVYAGTKPAPRVFTGG